MRYAKSGSKNKRLPSVTEGRKKTTKSVRQAVKKTGNTFGAKKKRR